MARRLMEPFVFCLREGLRELAADGRCVGQDYRVLLYLLGSLEWDNLVRVSQTQVATVDTHQQFSSLYESGGVVQPPRASVFRAATTAVWTLHSGVERVPGGREVYSWHVTIYAAANCGSMCASSTSP